MPKAKKVGEIHLTFVIITYVIGLYGGLVSGLIVALYTQPIPMNQLWIYGGCLLVLGLVILVVIDKLLRKRRK